ncbi:hypothetical protein LVB87_14330 [Lysobacter sp. KIS68-7]|uniref:STAS/SEC14 domain-containing protein n=1 Tax=Lysobacter sp. KIS68-7 TaxID=2904252 RepID=UPI001E38DCEE|nr:STAS/SEC14 domain-containing protein [Lysobacter sp. KIS68-7]UHQ19344.1 hypothetical protein LVB87_14330 [Lysobacter sp. KIS68-7]
MGHSVVVEAGAFVELRYSGAVTYEERAVAVDAVGRLLRESGLRRVLGDYRDAHIVESVPGARIDYVAKAISADILAGCRVAIIGLSPEHMRAAEMASIVRDITVKGFDDRESAIAWLAGG